MTYSSVLVDDDEATTEVFKDLLEIIGLNVVGVGHNGNDAVELYKKHEPNVIFTDIMMPEQDGFYAIEKIRKINPNSNIVVVTADLSNEIDEKLQRMKISAIIHKPFDINDIKKMLIEKFQFEI